jgi:heat shock protein HtpX
MPFSFVQIEKDESRTILWSFVFLIFFYFSGVLLLFFVVKSLLMAMYSSEYGVSRLSFQNVFDLPTLIYIFVAVLLWSVVHWGLSTNRMVENVLSLMNARPVDPSKNDEKMFQNVVEEAGVATGGKYRIEPYIIPVSAMNAFAVQNFEGRSVIGITEGLLKRLNRGQLEAVIAHEAGHIASGDSLSTCVTSSVFRVFDNICDFARILLDGFSRGRGRRDGRILLVLLIVLVIASVLRFVGFLGSMFISRRREYRADAISVRLTRNPQALAEALYIISNRWKGGGMPGQSMDAIFIMSPRRSGLEEQQNFFADLFTTHPPINRRIGILLDMAHGGEQDLEKALKRSVEMEESLNEKFAAPVSAADRPLPITAPVLGAGVLSQGVPAAGNPCLWMVQKGLDWVGPKDLAGVAALGWILPGTMVRRVGSARIIELREDKELVSLFARGAPREIQKDHCPRCHVGLGAVSYEGVPIQKCATCEGVLVKEMDVLTIVGKRELQFSPSIVSMGDLMMLQAKLLARNPYDAIYDEKGIYCPTCLTTSPCMTRRFINQRYPIEIDKCRICSQVWFDKDELETLQYLYEKDHPLSADQAQPTIST